MEDVDRCSLKTAQKKQENLKQGRLCVLMHKVFLTEVFYRKVESNRIDFPKQIRIKRKYLTERDKFRFHVGSALKIPLDARKPTET